MKYDEDARHFVLSNGRTFQGGANRAIGLSPDDEYRELSVGADSNLHMDDHEELTNEEKIEIAEYVISQWTEYLTALRRGDSRG